MRQRAEDVGGSLQVFSDAAGTCVEATVPLVASPLADAEANQRLSLALAERARTN